MTNRYSYRSDNNHISVDRCDEHLTATVGDARIEVIGGYLIARGFRSVDEVLHELSELCDLNKECS